MIFAVITKTPCVVLPNNNHKILQTYNDWLSGIKHIWLLQQYNLSNILNVVKELLELDQIEVEKPDFTKQLFQLESFIKNAN